MFDIISLRGNLVAQQTQLAMSSRKQSYSGSLLPRSSQDSTKLSPVYGLIVEYRKALEALNSCNIQLLQVRSEKDDEHAASERFLLPVAFFPFGLA